MVTRIKRWFAKRRLVDTPFYERTRYEFDGAILRASDPLGTEQSISAAKICDVAVETNCLGPFVEDVFWRISDESVVILVPQCSPVFTELMKHFEAFEGFDWDAFRRSMGCTDDALFRCWTRKSPHEQKA